jgi:hypothetical protein
MQTKTAEVVCGCGCGKAPLSPKSAFLPGHNARMRKSSKGGNATVRTRSLCACGCGGECTSARARFLHGHNSRTPEWQVGYGKRHGMGRWQTCPESSCQKFYRVHPYEFSTRKACSRWCALMLRHRAAARNDLQRRILERMSQMRASIAAFERVAGFRRAVLEEWFRGDHDTLKQDHLDRLAKTLDISLEQCIREAGGETSNDRHADIGRRTGPTNLPVPGSPAALAARSKAAETQRGRPQPRAAIARRQETREATGVLQAAVEAMVAANRSQDGRLGISLRSRLRLVPTPTSDTLRDWATDVSASFGLCIGQVVGRWNPVLHSRGFPRLVGRRGDQHRCDALRARLLATPRTVSGHLPHGFWPNVALTLDVPDDWVKDHRRICLALKLALSGGQIPNLT